MHIPPIQKKMTYSQEPVAADIVGEDFWKLLNMSERLLLDECFRMLAANKCYVFELSDYVMPRDEHLLPDSNTARD